MSLKIFLVITIHLYYCEGADVTDISRLRSVILTNYDRNTRPVQSHYNATHVAIYFYNNGFEFNEKKGVLTLHALLDLTWRDEHVQWNPLNYGNLTQLHFHPTELWLPDIAVMSTDPSQIDHFGNALIFAMHTSVLYWFPPAKFILDCELDYYRWPYDMQKCKMVVFAWDHDGSEVFLTVPENHTKMDQDLPYTEGKGPLPNREWALVDNSIERRTEHYECCPGVPFLDVVLTMTIQRRNATHTAGVVIVAIGLATALLMTFWLNPCSNERIPVILVAMLLNSIYLNYIYKIIPNNGNRVPWAVCYFRDSLVMTQTAFAWTIFLRYIAKTKRNSGVPLPNWVESLLEGVIAKLLCINPRPTADNGSREIPKDTDGLDDNDELVKKEIFYKEDWGWFANILDRIAFLCYLIVYACFIIAF